jgi:DNA repair ATPase RecN
LLKSLKIEGYQSLQDVKLDLAPFTVIVGESNVGKTAVIRAVRALLENETGTSFITKGKRSAIVLIEKDNVSVRWQKTAKIAEYDIIVGNDVRSYGKTGGAVPEDVVKAMRMGEISLGSGIKFTPNFHNQFSLPFLADETSPRVAKILGELSGVNILYMATQSANTLAKRTSRDKETVGAELADRLKQVQEFVSLKRRGELLEQAKVKRESYYKSMTNLLRCQEYLTDLRQLTDRVAALNKVEVKIAPIAKVDLEAASDKAAMLNRMVEALNDLRRQIKRVLELGQMVAAAEELMEAKHKELHEFEEKLGVCPLCERPMGDKNGS